MIKYFIRIVIINMAYAIDVVATLLILNQWLDLKPNKIKIIIYVLIGLGVLLTCTMFLLHTKYDFIKFFDAVKMLGKISILIFLLGAVSEVAKISFLGIERGSTSYFVCSYPALLPLISNLMCFLFVGE